MDRHVDLREQTPVEYFKEQVESALARQHLQAGDLTEYYLVNLLCRYVRPDHGDNDHRYANYSTRIDHCAFNFFLEPVGLFNKQGDSVQYRV